MLMFQHYILIWQALALLLFSCLSWLLHTHPDSPDWLYRSHIVVPLWLLQVAVLQAGP